MHTSWDAYFLEQAKLASSRSKDPSSQVGAVIADARHRLVSQGYNGFPRGVKDHDGRLLDRQLKLKMVIHAEVNAILFAQRDLSGCCMYIHPFLSCAPCAALIIQSGIARVVTPADLPGRWSDDSAIVREMFDEAGVILLFTGGR